MPLSKLINNAIIFQPNMIFNVIFMPNSYWNHYAQFETGKTILTCLNYGWIDLKCRKGSLLTIIQSFITKLS